MQICGEERDVAIGERHRHFQDADRYVELVLFVERLSVVFDAESVAARVEVVGVLLEEPIDRRVQLTL